MIPAWRVGEIEFQCHLAQFVISERLELRLASGESKWGLKGKHDEFGRKTRCTTRKARVPDVQFEVGKGSADDDGGAQNEIEGQKSRQRHVNRD
jgi:hypothetical protein